MRASQAGPVFALPLVLQFYMIVEKKEKEERTKTGQNRPGYKFGRSQCGGGMERCLVPREEVREVRRVEALATFSAPQGGSHSSLCVAARFGSGLIVWALRRQVFPHVAPLIVCALRRDTDVLCPAQWA
jgi:hypothetical protein